MATSLTFLETQDAVKRLAKVSGNEFVINELVKDAINYALVDVAQQSPDHQLVVSETSLSPLSTNPTVLLTLPNNFLAMKYIEYLRAGPQERHPLSERSGIVQPAPGFGIPAWYEVVSSNLSVDPFSKLQYGPRDGVAGTDSIIINFYKLPARLINDAEFIPSISWNEEIIKRAAALVEIYRDNIEQGNAYMSMALHRMQSTEDNKPTE